MPESEPRPDDSAKLARESQLWDLSRVSLVSLLAEYERVTGQVAPGASPEFVRRMVSAILNAEFPPRRA